MHFKLHFESSMYHKLHKQNIIMCYELHQKYYVLQRIHLIAYVLQVTPKKVCT